MQPRSQQAGSVVVVSGPLCPNACCKVGAQALQPAEQPQLGTGRSMERRCRVPACARSCASPCRHSRAADYRAAAVALWALVLAHAADAKPTQMVVFGDSLADDGGARSFREISQEALSATFAQPYPLGQGLGTAAALAAAQPFVSAHRSCSWVLHWPLLSLSMR